MSPVRAQATGQRLVSTALVLTALVPVVAAAVTLAVDGAPGPLWWAGLALAAVVASFAAVVDAAVRAGPPSPPALALLVTTLTALLLTRASEGAGTGGPLGATPAWAFYLGIAALAACAVLVRRCATWRAGLTLLAGAGLVTVLRTPPAGAGSGMMPLVDAAFLTGLGVAVYAAVRGVEDVSGRVRTARAAALRADAEAEELASAEAERGRWEAAVHDDVLSALRVAAAARTPEEVSRAAEAARAALDGLARGPATLLVSTGLVVQQLRAAALSARPGTDVALSASPGSLPGSAAEALADATAEVLRNSARHNPPEVASRVRGHLAGDGVKLVVSDDGAGFDPELVPEGRLGIRVSVVGRMRSVGGDAEVTSAPGAGTAVRLRWPR